MNPLMIAMIVTTIASMYTQKQASDAAQEARDEAIDMENRRIAEEKSEMFQQKKSEIDRIKARSGELSRFRPSEEVTGQPSILGKTSSKQTTILGS